MIVMKNDQSNPASGLKMLPPLTPGMNAKYLDIGNSKDIFQFIPTPTLKSTQDKCCIFKALSPLISFGRFFLILPVEWDAVNFRISHSWSSALSWLSLVWSCWVVPVLTIAFPLLLKDLNDHFFGTSYYAYALSIFTQTFTAGVVHLCGNFNAIFLSQAWMKLAAVTVTLSPKEFQKIKHIVNICRIYLSFGLIVVIILLGWNINGGDPMLKYLSWITPFYAFFTVFTSDLLASIFVALVLVIFFNFKEINDQLNELVLEKFEHTKIAQRIFQLRRHHDELCKIIQLLQTAFGVQILATFISASICFVTALYTFLLVVRGEATKSITGFGLPISIQTMVVSSIRLLSIILSCQKLVNEANRSKIILYKFDDEVLSKSEDLSFEVEAFLKKHGNSSIRIVCCDVLEIGNSFLASGLSFVVTCILVLIQLNDGEKKHR